MKRKNHTHILNSLNWLLDLDYNFKVILKVFGRSMSLLAFEVLFALFQLGTSFQYRFYRINGNFTGSVIGMATLPSLASCAFNCQTSCQGLQYFSYKRTCMLFKDVNNTLNANETNKGTKDSVFFRVCTLVYISLTHPHYV